MFESLLNIFQERLTQKYQLVTLNIFKLRVSATDGQI